MTLARWILVLLISTTATAVMAAEWFDDYEAGLEAAEARRWSAVVEKMNAAIAKRPKEGARQRTYGNIFIDYYPYYYRGVALYNLGEYAKAIEDLQKTTGVGRVRLDSAESLISKAQAKLTPTTTTPPPVSPPPPPAVDPEIAPARQRAIAALNDAKVAKARAESQQAALHASQPFLRGVELFAEAQTRESSAKSAADWAAAAEAASKARSLFETAETMARTKVAATTTASGTTATTATSAPPPKPAVQPSTPAATRASLRRALDGYYSGNYDDSIRELERLTRTDLSGNAMAWAFLGAAHYSKFCLNESSPEPRTAATAAFRKARGLERNLMLPESWFSPRIRAFFASVR